MLILTFKQLINKMYLLFILQYRYLINVLGQIMILFTEFFQNKNRFVKSKNMFIIHK